PYKLRVQGVEDVAGNSVAANTSVNFVSFGRVNGVVGVEIWKNIGGGAVTDLTGNPRYPNDYDIDYYTTTLDSQLVVPASPDLNTYGGRLRAWVTPTVSGDYEFFLSTDTQGELRLSMEAGFDNIDDPNLMPIATDNNTLAGFQEPGTDTSTSLP